MGCDIHGFLEIRLHGFWHAVLRLDWFLGRNYRAFCSLFGVRCYDDEEPVSGADLRGFPEDADDLTREEFKKWEMGAHSVTWVTYKEFKETLFKAFGDDVMIFKRYKDENIFVLMKKTSFRGIPKDVRYSLEESMFVLRDDMLYVRGSIVIENLSWDWLLLLWYMDMAAKKVGDENVRVVVWFDS